MKQHHALAFICSALACASASTSAAPVTMRGGVGVALVSEYGAELETYQHRGRYYILGDTGARYAIRITNPTAARVEAVVTVDGLDVIDGKAGDMQKRGYLIAPYGEVTIEGFRTSTQDVAAFRFAPVSASYAARTGSARNVGVIAVALFAEQQRPRPRPIAVPSPDPVPFEPADDYRYKGDVHSGRGMSQQKAPAAPPASANASDNASGSYGGTGRAAERDEARGRAGLGTEFGERRDSQIQYTRFVRASARPFAISEMRYNDAHGLRSLGIRLLGDGYDDQDLRETANPFPGDQRFAQPPRY